MEKEIFSKKADTLIRKISQFKFFKYVSFKAQTTTFNFFLIISLKYSLKQYYEQKKNEIFRKIQVHFKLINLRDLFQLATTREIKWTKFDIFNNHCSVIHILNRFNHIRTFYLCYFMSKKLFL